MGDLLPKAIAAALPAALYDTMYRGSSITQALPLAVTVGVCSAVGDMISNNFIAPAVGVDNRIVTPLVSGGLFYVASKQLNLFGYGSTMNIVAEGAVFSAIGGMLLPHVNSYMPNMSNASSKIGEFAASECVRAQFFNIHVV